MGQSILAGKDYLKLENGMTLRLLSAMEVLRARDEANALTKQEDERAVCSNACLLAYALQAEGENVFKSGRDVLCAMTVEEISALARTWSEWNEAENTKLLCGQAQAQAVKKN